ncbi:substrate-binding domain-containing protein [Vibrio fluvialis]|uniref:substrate-binding domain-containing protein n=1 Tax=Vibrio fluvialis TaxID=676 RepID=UPI001EEB80F2|nr:hypothetical protein [Vibrio fluvialis]MCG6399897.1 hypothetical protein [Vibrio fluvialis]
MRINRAMLLTFAALSQSVMAAMGGKSAETWIGTEPTLLPLMTALIESQDSLKLTASDSIPRAMADGRLTVAVMSRKWTDEEMSEFYAITGEHPIQLFFSAKATVLLGEKDTPLDAVILPNKNDGERCNYSLYFVKGSEGINPDLLLGHCADKPEFLASHEVEKDAVANLIADNELVKAAVDYSEKHHSSQWADYKEFSVVDDHGRRHAATIETIYSGRYPLATLYYMYVVSEKTLTRNEDAKRVLDWVVTDQYRNLFEERGFIGLPPSLILRNQIKLGLEQPEISQGYK